MKKRDGEIVELFKKRDEAVGKKDKKVFLESQVGEMAWSFSGGYLRKEKMETEILEVVEGKSKLEKKVAVKERYFEEGKVTHEELLIYWLIDTKEGWKVYRIVW